MSEEQQMATNPNAPTSWRDVYQLVQDTEARLTTAIKAGFDAQSKVTNDHEVRIRVLEKTDNKQAGGMDTISSGRALLMTVLSLISATVALIALVRPA